MHHRDKNNHRGGRNQKRDQQFLKPVEDSK
jgi:hypothetical protein